MLHGLMFGVSDTGMDLSVQPIQAKLYDIGALSKICTRMRTLVLYVGVSCATWLWLGKMEFRVSWIGRRNLSSHVAFVAAAMLFHPRRLHALGLGMTVWSLSLG